MGDGKRIVSWMLHYFLDEHYGGSRTRMAEAIGVSRHTLWRAIKATDTGNGKISILVVQQLIWSCVQNDYSMDRAIRRYAAEVGRENAEHCRDVLNWWDQMQNVNAGPPQTSEMIALAQEFILEMKGLLGCKLSHADLAEEAPMKCKHTRQQLLTLRGQALGGDVVGARRGLDKLLLTRKG